MSIKKIKGTDYWQVSLSLRHNGKRLPRVERIARATTLEDGTVLSARDHAIKMQDDLRTEIRAKAKGTKTADLRTPTIAQWVALFFEKKYTRLDGNSRSTMISRIAHFTEFCRSEGIEYLRQVTPKEAASFWALLESKYKGRGPGDKFAAASTLISFAMAQGNTKIETNPLKSVTRVQPEQGNDGRWLEDEEVDAILSVAQSGPEDGYLSYIILLETLMRRDELRNLPKDLIDFRRHSAHITSHHNWRPKTKRSRRHVPLSQRAEMAMKRLIEKYPDSEYLLPAIDKRKVGPRGENWLQKHWDKLRPLVIERSPWMRPALEEMENGKHVLSIHCLRHTGASRLLQEGVDLHTIAQIMGHEDKYVTETYAKLAKSNLHAAISRLNNRTLNNYGTENGTALILQMPKTGS